MDTEQILLAALLPAAESDSGPGPWLPGGWEHGGSAVGRAGAAGGDGAR